MLVELFGELAKLVGQVQLENQQAIRDTLDALIEAEQEAKAKEPRHSVVVQAWERAKTWIGGALSVGVFALTVKERVTGLLERVGKLLS